MSINEYIEFVLNKLISFYAPNQYIFSVHKQEMMQMKIVI
jgi:hypothetical protein